MVVIRRATVLNLPLGSIVATVLFGLLLAHTASEPGASLATLATLAAAVLLFVIMSASQFRVTRRVDEELHVFGCFAPKRALAARSELRASINGTRSPILDIELFVDREELGTTVAILGASAKGRARAEALAEALGMELGGELPEPPSAGSAGGRR